LVHTAIGSSQEVSQIIFVTSFLLVILKTPQHRPQKLTHSYSQTLFSSRFYQFSWLYNQLPLPLQFPLGSNTKCSSVLGALTLDTVLLEISTRLLLTRESIPSLMTTIFKEEMKSHQKMPLKNPGFLFPYCLQTMHLLHFVWTNLSTSFIATRQRVVRFCLFSMVWILLTYDVRLEVTVSILLSMKRSSKITRKTWRGWSNGRWLLPKLLTSPATILVKGTPLYLNLIFPFYIFFSLISFPH